MSHMSRKGRKRFLKRLRQARLGRWVGEGKDRKFIPLSKQENERLASLVRENKYEDQDVEGIETKQFRWFNQYHGKFGFGGHWKRTGMDKDWWGKGIDIKFKAKAYAKMVYYCQSVGTEVSGFGKINEIKDSTGKITTIEVVDVLLLKQECTAGYTELDEACMSNFVYQLAKKGEDTSQWKLWWHTHNDFGVFWSGIDDATVERLIKFTNGYLISTCINKKCDIIGRIDVMENNNQLSADCKIGIKPVLNPKWKSTCIRQAKRLVTEKVYQYKTVDFSHFTGFNQRQESRQRLMLPAPGYGFSNVMNNWDRRRIGAKQDKNLPDYQPDFDSDAIPDRGMHGYPMYEGQDWID